MSGTTSFSTKFEVVTLSTPGQTPEAEGEFGANAWLVEEMYEQYKVNPDAVDREWWPILERFQSMQTLTPNPAPAPTAVTEAAPTTDTQLIAKTTRVEPRSQPIPARSW